MLLLESKEILAAVARSLEHHVLPRLADPFARVQVLAALKALQEVGDRLEGGDPCEALNQSIEAGARAIADECAASAPEFSRRLGGALDSVGDIENARERNRALGDALWALVEDDRSAAAARLLEHLRSRALASANADNAYLCVEAIASLT